MAKNKYKKNGAKQMKSNNITITDGQDLPQNLIDGIYNLRNNNSTYSTNTLTNGTFLREYVRRNYITFDYTLISYLVQGSGVVQRGIGSIVDACFANKALSINIPSIGEDSIDFTNYLYNQNYISGMKNALKVARTYGGSVIKFHTRDEISSNEVAEYPDEGEDVIFTVYDNWMARGLKSNETTVFTRRTIEENLSFKKGVNETFIIDSQAVPETRLIFITNPSSLALPYTENILKSFGISELEGCINELSRYFKYSNVAFQGLDRAIQTVYKVEGLASAMMTGNEYSIQSNMRRLVDALAVNNNYKSVIPIDKDNELETTAIDTSYIGDAYDRCIKDLAIAFNMPLTVLVGESAGGLNATGEDTQEQWANNIEAFREDIRKYILAMVQTAYGIYTQGKQDLSAEEIEINWKPARTEKIEDAINKKNAVINQITQLANAGLLKDKSTAIQILNQAKIFDVELPDMAGDFNMGAELYEEMSFDKK